MFIFKKDIPTLQRNLDRKRAKTRLDSPCAGAATAGEVKG